MPDARLVRTVDVNEFPGLSDIVADAVRAGEVLLTGAVSLWPGLSRYLRRKAQHALRAAQEVQGMIQMSDDFGEMPTDFDGIF